MMAGTCPECQESFGYGNFCRWCGERLHPDEEPRPRVQPNINDRSLRPWDQFSSCQTFDLTDWWSGDRSPTPLPYITDGHALIMKKYCTETIYQKLAKKNFWRQRHNLKEVVDGLLGVLARSRTYPLRIMGWRRSYRPDFPDFTVYFSRRDDAAEKIYLAADAYKLAGILTATAPDTICGGDSSLFLSFWRGHDLAALLMPLAICDL